MNIPSITQVPTSVVAPVMQPPGGMTDAAARTPGSRPADAASRASSLRDANTANERSETRAPGSPEDLQKALEEVQSAINVVANDLRFSFDEDTGRTLVKIVDRETDEVIKQIPSEELVQISKALDKLQGLLVKQEA